MAAFRAGRDGDQVLDDPNLRALGAAIRRIRLGQKKSQFDLAHEAGLSTNYVSDLERGQRNVGIKAIFKIAKSLGVSVASLFTD